MDSNKLVKRICLNGILLALFCVVGMFSIPIGPNVKVSLQLLMVFLISLIVPSFIDGIIICGCYLALGLFLPIYAGFNSFISPTFGFVIGFVLASPVIFFLNKIPKLDRVFRMILACLGGTIVVYISGSLFLSLYLQIDYFSSLTISVLPYLPFDAVKIAIAILLVNSLPSFLKEKPQKEAPKEEEKE